MKKITLILTGFVFAVAINSMAQKVTVDYDKSTDFSEMKTFTFLGWQEGIDNMINAFDKERFLNAFKAEFKSRNIERVENDGDMIIGVYIVIEEKRSVTAYSNYYGGYGGGRGRGYRGGRYGGGHSTTQYSEEDYLVGTMVLDIFDGKSSAQLWEGVATKTVNEKPAKREKGIPKSVNKLMKKFPIKPVK